MLKILALLLINFAYLSPVHAEQITDSQLALSPDGTQQVFIRELPNKTSELWIMDASGSNAHAIVHERYDDDVKKNLTGLNTPLFSLNGKAVYFLSEAWATSNAVHVIDLSTNTQRFITDGNSLELIPHGKYQNYLIVSKHKYHDNEGGSFEEYWLVSPQGKDIKAIGESEEQVNAFIQAN
ncbi:hypothetical protein BCS42_06480 [Crenothrix sp. D3]|nr:hypothetical protein BCS42_06480 [Crenothrix sp. D3]